MKPWERAFAALDRQFGCHVGYDADWCVAAWHIFGDPSETSVWITDVERASDGAPLFDLVVRRWDDDEGTDHVTSLLPDDVEGLTAPAVALEALVLMCLVPARHW